MSSREDKGKGAWTRKKTGTRGIARDIVAEGTDSTAAETLPEAPRKARGKAPGKVRGRRRLQHRHRSRVGLWLALALIVLALALGVVGMALTGRTISLPVWAVAEIETRLNRAITDRKSVV